MTSIVNVAVGNSEVVKQQQVAGSELKEASFLNACGTKYQNQHMYTKAISLYRRALKCIPNFKKSNFNMGTCLYELANKQDSGDDKIKKAFFKKAIKHYEVVITETEKDLPSLKRDNNAGAAFKDDLNMSRKKMNKHEKILDMYASSLLNVAALQMKFDNLKIAHEIILKILRFNDDGGTDRNSSLIIGEGTIKEAYYSLNSILRRMGKKDYAIKTFKEKMNQEIRNINCRTTEIIDSIDIAMFSADEQTKDNSNKKLSNSANNNLAVICVKWGAKYGVDYLINLYNAVQRNLSIPHNFYCLTDNVNDLGNNDERNKKIIGIELEKGTIWTGWWNKAMLFSERVYTKLHKDTRRILYIDLDTVITGSLDSMVSNYNGLFSILSTNGLDNEGKDFTNGYNSSIMMWHCKLNHSLHQTIYKPLLNYMNVVQHFIYRFDHWLEMNIENADLLQTLYPNTILEYLHDCKDGKLPENGLGCIVNFPLKPKPHEVVMKDSWVAKHWLAGSIRKE
jgi:tetratricopeptide (TPR) repeat protein